MKHILLLISVMLMEILGSAEVDLFVPSFPDMKMHFSLSTYWVEALLSVNFIGYCLSLFFVGGLSDRYGRKPIILLGLMIFLIGSILCLSTAYFPLLLVGRFLQGLGVAAPAVLAFLIIADNYELKKQQTLMGMLNGLVNVTVGAAPIIGSYVTLYFHWQGNFIVLLLLGMITFLMTCFFVPRNKLPEIKEPLSLRGFIPILQSGPLMLMIISIVLMCLPYWIFIGLSPILFIEDLGVSLEHFGYYQGTYASVFAIGTIFGSMIIHKYNHKKMLIYSILLCLASCLLIASLAYQNTTNPLYITLALLPFFVSTIIPNILIFPLCLNYLSYAKGRISASIQALRLILSALVLQLAGAFYVGSFRNIGIILAITMILLIITLIILIRDWNSRGQTTL